MNVHAQPTFADQLAADGDRFERTSLSTVQINLGKVCNQTCRHCHVDASPFRTEDMTDATATDVLAFLARSGATTSVRQRIAGASSLTSLSPSARMVTRSWTG